MDSMASILGVCGEGEGASVSEAFWLVPARIPLLNHCTEGSFASFLSGGFISAIVVNSLENKLAKRTSVHCSDR